ncbi:MAG: 50S ribosomal protein L19 [Hyphomicrobiales bacterium]|jgi:large subunit ribosomal protein L19|nr:50S ribosomal protein L19 [Alphaproteobacteria bacterium]MDG1153002.1 50S ribosomal protein L19 [Hyphomicrobiales bacterium]MBT4909903.1 50S ribosomal protein L19 [Alphaproteobacteria bacterium]MBT5663212.1 50S ribosomal protein L19 [Alphaproteobacteria bacterium]MDG1523957.1 50S ribosomal protein L19 [Hyphomicrobiales bacterium]|tara:strand:- start:62 stop:481 length:420 start_codon:yes stop_codon:yes gene_type:complete
MNIIETLEAKHVEELTKDKAIPDFRPGDTLKVNVRIKEGERERLQAYEGVCISRSGKSLNQNFTVRKISYGEGVERVFSLYGPSVDSIEVVRSGRVRRSKLYYLRSRRGKSARITERKTFTSKKASKAADISEASQSDA